MSLTACSNARSITVETELPKLAAQDNRECDPLGDAPKSARPAEGTYDLAHVVARVDELQNKYRECKALQKRNLTVLREERKG